MRYARMLSVALTLAVTGCATVDTQTDDTKVLHPFEKLQMLPVPDAGELTKVEIAASDEDIDLMARTIWGEARKEPSFEMEMIANVIVNRTLIGMGGWNIRDVILADRQFSVWNRCAYRRVSYPRRSLVKIGTRYVHTQVLEHRTICGWNKNRALTLAATMSNPDMIRAREVAVKVINGRRDGTLHDNSCGADHYHARYVRPVWAKKKYQVAAAGAHLFYSIGFTR